MSPIFLSCIFMSHFFHFHPLFLVPHFHVSYSTSPWSRRLTLVLPGVARVVWRPPMRRLWAELACTTTSPSTSSTQTVGDSPPKLRSQPAANARATSSQIYRPSTNCWKTPRINCSINSVITPNTHSIIFFYHLIWHHNITISDPLHLITDNYLVPTCSGHRIDANFITRFLCKDYYWFRTWLWHYSWLSAHLSLPCNS